MEKEQIAAELVKAAAITFAGEEQLSFDDAEATVWYAYERFLNRL